VLAPRNAVDMPPKAAKKPAAEPVAAPAALDPEAETERRFLIEQCKAMKGQRIFEEAGLAQFHEEKVCNAALICVALCAKGGV